MMTLVMSRFGLMETIFSFCFLSIFAPLKILCNLIEESQVTENASSHPISFYYGASILRMAVCNCFKGGIKIMKCLFFAICSVCLFFPSSPNNNSLARGSVHLTCLASTETRARPPCFGSTEFGRKSCPAPQWLFARGFENYLLDAPPAICAALIPATAQVAPSPWS